MGAGGGGGGCKTRIPPDSPSASCSEPRMDADGEEDKKRVTELVEPVLVL